LLRRYAAIEAEAQQVTDKVGLEFAQLKLQMYKPSVLTLLHNVQAFDHQQFSSNKAWIVPMLPQFVLCEDKQVRGFISDILSQHVNPRLLA
jgi:hypothetical protein